MMPTAPPVPDPASAERETPGRRRPAEISQAKRSPPTAAGRATLHCHFRVQRPEWHYQRDAPPDAQPVEKFLSTESHRGACQWDRVQTAADTPHSGHRDVGGAERASFPPSLSARQGRAGKQKARCLCVTSGESSGDNGNMALNGAGEAMDCGGLWLRGSGGTLLQQDLPAPCASLPPEVDDFSWEPPTEAETKVLQARRERQDRISRLMGDYLLRGYRMLGETCADCGVRRYSGRGIQAGAADQATRPFPLLSPLNPVAGLTPAPCAFWPLDDPPPRQTAENLLRGLSGARFRRG